MRHPMTMQRACLLGPVDPLFWVIIIPMAIGIWMMVGWLLILWAAMVWFFRNLGTIVGVTLVAALILWVV